jgi:hypothetical protein
MSPNPLAILIGYDPNGIGRVATALRELLIDDEPTKEAMELVFEDLQTLLPLQLPGLVFQHHFDISHWPKELARDQLREVLVSWSLPLPDNGDVSPGRFPYTGLLITRNGW